MRIRVRVRVRARVRVGVRVRVIFMIKVRVFKIRYIEENSRIRGEERGGEGMSLTYEQ